MRCRDCFHWDACGESSPYNDANMCKQFINRSDVLCGPALKVVLDDYAKLKERNERLEQKINLCEYNKRELEVEVELLRIIKQTLEMQSGMTFDF